MARSASTRSRRRTTMPAPSEHHVDPWSDHAVNPPTDASASRGWGRNEIDALLRVSRAVGLQPHLSDVLDVIATEACSVTRAKAASILLTDPGETVFHLAASSGLSRDYERFLQSHFVRYGQSISRAAAQLLRPIVVDDVANDPRVNRPEAREWKRFALRENYRASLSVPLLAGSQSSGVLNLYRAEVGPWLSAEVEVAATFAQYAASAIHSAKLMESQRRQVDALGRLVAVLRDQTHEYANRLHAVSGLLALGEQTGAQEFLSQLISIHHESYASVMERVQPPILAGLLIAQMSVARQRGVEVRLDQRTNLQSLPPLLGAAEAVTIVANLIENAIEAVSEVRGNRRRVSVRINQNPQRVVIAVRDWGPGFPAGTEEEALARGSSSKDGHPGIGLALVSEAVASAGATLTVGNAAPGALFVVTLPNQPEGTNQPPSID
jgi:GAF domain-containing protein